MLTYFCIAQWLGLFGYPSLWTDKSGCRECTVIYIIYSLTRIYNLLNLEVLQARLSKLGSYIGLWEVNSIVDCKIPFFGEKNKKHINSDFVVVYYEVLARLNLDLPH